MSTKRKKKSKSRAKARPKVRQVKKATKRRKPSSSGSSSLYTIAMPTAALRATVRALRLPTAQQRSALSHVRRFDPGRSIVAASEWYGSKMQAAALAARLSLMLSYMRGRSRAGFSPCMPDVVRVPRTNPKVTATRVPLDRGGYDKRGGYWGVGEKLWSIDDVDTPFPRGSSELRQRAPTSKAALAKYFAAVGRYKP